jgi:glutathione synthase/RimK-type ligase-like ATP-grasp enzyme
MIIKDFQTFLNERFAEHKIPQIQIIMRDIGLSPKQEDFTKRMLAEIYEKYAHLVLVDDNGYNQDERIPDNRRHNKTKYDEPILNFMSVSHTELEKMKARVYNKVEDIQIAADKIKFYREFDQTDFVPNCAYKLDDIEKLELPIIAKPAIGESAQGIEKFDTYEDAKSSKMKFDVWQEAKEIDREFRAFVMNNKIIHLCERVTNTKNDKSVGKKDANEKIDLVYLDQDMSKFPHMDEMEKIKEELSKKVKLEFYNIDLMLDKDGTMWVPELNGNPGIGPGSFTVIYKHWIEWVYDQKLSEEIDKDLKDMAKAYREGMKKEHPDEYAGSLSPI